MAIQVWRFATEFSKKSMSAAARSIEAGSLLRFRHLTRAGLPKVPVRLPKARVLPLALPRIMMRTTTKDQRVQPLDNHGRGLVNLPTAASRESPTGPRAATCVAPPKSKE